MSKNDNLIKKSKYLLGKMAIAEKYIPKADIQQLLQDLCKAYQVKKDIKLIDAKKSILIEEMTKKYELYYKVFSEIFSERMQAIDKSFEIIDKGLIENDKALISLGLISLGLNSLSQVVSSSPFGNLTELSKLLEGNDVIEL